jgi:glycosyltransferase involved in cell wall biosynthesis
VVTTILASATADETEALVRCGPRRDFLELARAVEGRTLYRRARRARRGFVGKLLGGHVGQAWRAARDASPGDTLFADGEHAGIPLALFLAMRAKRRVHVVMLGHFVTKPWKQLALTVTCLASPGTTLLLHSTRQLEKLNRLTRARWSVRLLPYHVDTVFWEPKACGGSERLVLAVGSEGRDYDCLSRASRLVAADVLIAAGSHWARRTATAEANSRVRYVSSPLSFADLRTLYERASVVVVPLRSLDNQSGVTTILEAMSMERPVVVTANEGQLELVRGPLVTPDGGLDWEATNHRGPSLFGIEEPACGPTGLYVVPESPESLAGAINLLLKDPDLRQRMGAAARRHAVACFDTSLYTERLAAELREVAR